jgi:hypothetical protein
VATITGTRQLSRNLELELSFETSSGFKLPVGERMSRWRSRCSVCGYASGSRSSRDSLARRAGCLMRRFQIYGWKSGERLGGPGCDAEPISVQAEEFHHGRVIAARRRGGISDLRAHLSEAGDARVVIRRIEKKGIVRAGLAAELGAENLVAQTRDFHHCLANIVAIARSRPLPTSRRTRRPTRLKALHWHGRGFGSGSEAGEQRRRLGSRAAISVIQCSTSRDPYATLDCSQTSIMANR